MGKKKTKQEVRPHVAEPLGGGVNDLTNRIGAFGGTDPHQYVAPAAPLQQQAFGGVQNLGGWHPGIAQAQNMVQAADALGPAHATPFGYDAPQLGAPSQATAATAQAAQLGPAQQAQRRQLGTAPLAEAARLGPSQNAQAYLAGFQDLLANGGIQRYINSGTEAFVDSSIASFDHDAAKRQAANEAVAAKMGAFGGSRLGVQQGIEASEDALNRGFLAGSLRRDAYGLGLNAAIADAQRRSSIDLANAANLTGISQFNAGQANQFARDQAGFEQQRNLSNQALLGQYGLAQGQIDHGTDLFNVGAQNDFALNQGRFQQDVNLFNTGEINRTNLYNAGVANDFTLQQAGLDANAVQFGATAQNQASLANAGFTDADMNRSLQAAGIYGGLANDMGNQYRADLGLMAGLGDVQRDIASQYANAIPQQLMMLSQLYGGVYPAYIGQNSTTTQSGGLGGAVLGALAGSIGNGLMGGTKPWILGR